MKLIHIINHSCHFSFLDVCNTVLREISQGENFSEKTIIDEKRF